MAEQDDVRQGQANPVFRTPAPTSRRQAFDPFFVFTYALLALAGLVQIFVMISMDLF